MAFSGWSFLQRRTLLESDTPARHRMNQEGKIKRHCSQRDLVLILKLHLSCTVQIAYSNVQISCDLHVDRQGLSFRISRMDVVYYSFSSGCFHNFLKYGTVLHKNNKAAISGMLPCFNFLMDTRWALIQLLHSQPDFSSFTRSAKAEL